jgi:multiple sugar transport system permease protein
MAAPASTATAGVQQHPRASRTARTVALVVIGALFLIPMLWMLLASFDSKASFLLKWPEFTLANYRYALSSGRTTIPMWNSFLLASGTTVLTTVLGLGSAYALSRYHIRFRRSILLMVLFATGLPIELLMIPAYSLFVTLKLIDSIPATILFMSAAALPFAICACAGAHPQARAAARRAGDRGRRAVHLHERLGPVHHPVRTDPVGEQAAGLGGDL